MKAVSIDAAPPVARPTAEASAIGDLLYDAFYGAAIGGSVIAVFFLILDSVAGHPLFTPSLIGTVLLTGADAGMITDVRLDMVAYFSVAHFVAFLALGAGVSTMCRWTGLDKTNPVYVTGLVFLVLTGTFLVASTFLMPGISAVMGVQWILLANLLTAGSMGVFLHRAHQDD